MHKPALKEEVLRFLLTNKSGIYYDATLGTGGHTQAILENLGSAGRIVASDRDEKAIQIAKERLSNFSEKIEIGHYLFSQIKDFLKELEIEKIDGFLFDLGLCWLHLEQSERGFSYLKNGPLDMRMDQNQKTTAYLVVNDYPGQKLFQIFSQYGEDRFAKRIARTIEKERDKGKIETTFQLREIIEKIVGSKYRIKSWSRIFQAIRIEVNQELEEIKKGLETALEFLKSGGRIAVISYHSLEDRLVKDKSREWAKGCICPTDLPICQCGRKGLVKILTKKPVIPSDFEIKENSQARSAKLRVVEKL